MNRCIYIVCLVLVATSVFSFGSNVIRRLSGSGNFMYQKPTNTSFSVGVEILHRSVMSKSYGQALTELKVDQCLAYYKGVLAKACKPGLLYSPALCCSAVRAVIDEGKCLCEPRVFRGRVANQLGPSIQLARGCGIEFSIPWHLQDVAKLKECEDPISKSAQGYLNPAFLGLSKSELDSRSATDLPKFDDLFVAPEPGNYRVGHVKLDVTRKKKSSLINRESSPWSLPLDVYYPAAAEFENGEPVLNPGGPYPLVGFSPGFGANPHQHSHLLEYLASYGYIVISQRSTYHLGLDLSLSAVNAWKDDVAYMLRAMIDMGATSETIFYGMVDASRVALVGHSVGGGLILPAAVAARKDYDVHIETLVPLSAACIMLGDHCDVVSSHVPLLYNTQMRFLVGSNDITSPPRTSRFLASLLPKNSTSEVMILEGATHCLWGANPAIWESTNAECGKGQASPMDTLGVVLEQVRIFIDKELQTRVVQKSSMSDNQADI